MPTSTLIEYLVYNSETKITTAIYHCIPYRHNGDQIWDEFIKLPAGSFVIEGAFDWVVQSYFKIVDPTTVHENSNYIDATLEELPNTVKLFAALHNITLD